MGLKTVASFTCDTYSWALVAEVLATPLGPMSFGTLTQLVLHCGNSCRVCR